MEETEIWMKFPLKIHGTYWYGLYWRNTAQVDELRRVKTRLAALEFCIEGVFMI